MTPSWTLCTLFIDALWLWLCSQCCWCFSFFLVWHDWLYYPILFSVSFFSSFHIGYCVSGAFVLWQAYDANNAFIFYISLVIKKLFHAVYRRTQPFLSTVRNTPHLMIQSYFRQCTICMQLWSDGLMFGANSKFHMVEIKITEVLYLTKLKQVINNYKL